MFIKPRSSRLGFPRAGAEIRQACEHRKKHQFDRRSLKSIETVCVQLKSTLTQREERHTTGVKEGLKRSCARSFSSTAKSSWAHSFLGSRNKSETFRRRPTHIWTMDKTTARQACKTGLDSCPMNVYLSRNSRQRKQLPSRRWPNRHSASASLSAAAIFSRSPPSRARFSKKSPHQRQVSPTIAENVSLEFGKDGRGESLDDWS